MVVQRGQCPELGDAFVLEPISMEFKMFSMENPLSLTECQKTIKYTLKRVCYFRSACLFDTKSETRTICIPFTANIANHGPKSNLLRSSLCVVLNINSIELWPNDQMSYRRNGKNYYLSTRCMGCGEIGRMRIIIHQSIVYVYEWKMLEDAIHC